MDIKTFVEKNIENINRKITIFRKNGNDENDYKYSDLEIKKYLLDKFITDIKNPKIAEKLLTRLDEYNYVKARIENIANEEVYYKHDLTKYYNRNVFSAIFNKIDQSNLVRKILTLISDDNQINNKQYKFISSDLKKILLKAIFVSSSKGFPTDLNNAESGRKTSDEGDAAEFLFISRAIIAGFSCSKVDIRTSRYDVIIDFKSVLLRVQVKGITADSTISFVDRDRGGQGIDHTHERNKGARITHEDCDIYVAVDKQVGICYLIPMEDYADKLSLEEAKNINPSSIPQFRENWDLINTLAQKAKA